MNEGTKFAGPESEHQMQKSINVALAAAVAVLAVGFIAAIATRPAPGPSESDIRAMIAETVEARLSENLAAPNADTDVAQLDTENLGPLIEMYLMDNPRLLERMSVALEEEVRAAESERSRTALASLQDELYDDPDNIVLGNPDGDVTLVEMFDYNCGYCRQVVADVLELVEEDPNLRVILKEFPILSQGSVDAARVGILVNQADDVDYRDYHQALFSARGAVDAQAALAAAEELGLSRVALELDMNNDDVSAALQRSYTIAQSLGISGTPTFIIGNEVLPGAVPKEALAARIANMRECGEATCPDGPQEG